MNWKVASIVMVLIICGTLVWLNYNSWTIRFEMDENTKEAIESIEFDSLNNKEVWNCPILLEKGNYVFSDGVLISPNGTEWNCEKVKHLQMSQEVKG